MNFFKGLDGQIYALSDEDIANGGMALIPADCIPISEEEVNQILNPPPTYEQILTSQSLKLKGFKQLAEAQKAALTNRIGTLNDAIVLEEATVDEVAELPVRQSQLLEWKRYAIYLGRVTGQDGWPPDVEWPVQPAEGMDLTVSATAPEQM